MDNKWQTLSSEVKYDNRWINLTEYQVINPAGGKGIYGKVHFKNFAIGIIALDQHQNTWLVGQHRYTLNEWSWEIPEGGGPANEDVLESRSGLAPAEDGEKFAAAIIVDGIAANFVTAAQDAGARDQVGFFGPRVVLDPLAPAFNVFVQTIPFLAEVRDPARAFFSHAALESFRILLDRDAVGNDHQRALGQGDVAVENVDLAQIVIAHAVGLDIDRLVAIRLLGMRRQEPESAETGREDGWMHARNQGLRPASAGFR